MGTPLPKPEFREKLLSVMDRKHHWAWPHFSSADATTEQLKIHFQQEWAVYVRDFPVFLSRIHGQNPPRAARRLLAENIYEEDTGGLSLGHPHPELFLTMMRGLGYDPAEFEAVSLLPTSCHYREWLDEISGRPPWVRAAAALTIFVEGSIHDRGELQTSSPPRSREDIETYVAQHPLVRHRRLSPEAMDLVRAHQMVERGHRHAAYTIVLDHAVTAGDQDLVHTALERGLELWLQFRDGIAAACGLTPPPKAGG